jgi:hypothetical protein
MPEPYVLEIELPADAQRDLSEVLRGLGLSGEKGDDLGEAIGAALSMEATLMREANRGNKIVIVDKDGQQREVLLKNRAGTNGGRTDRS